MKKSLLPLPTQDSETRRLALVAIAYQNDELEKLALENPPDCVASKMGWYTESLVQAFQCLSLFCQKKGAEEVESLRAEFKALSFFEKMMFGGFEGNVRVIPGTGRPLNLFLFEGSPPFSSICGGVSCMDEWIKALYGAGLGGSVLVVSGNFPSCWKVASTGQVDALLMQDDDGWSSKVPHFRAYQEELRKLGLPVPPLFAHGGYTYSVDSLGVGLKKFFGKHFPNGR